MEIPMIKPCHQFTSVGLALNLLTALTIDIFFVKAFWIFQQKREHEVVRL